MDLKQGTRVEYNTQELKGIGTIVGIGMNALPIIGKMYIIQPDNPISNETYDYTHFVAWENQFKVI